MKILKIGFWKKLNSKNGLEVEMDWQMEVEDRLNLKLKALVEMSIRCGELLGLIV